MERHIIYGVTNNTKSNIIEMVIWCCRENQWKIYSKGKNHYGETLPNEANPP